MSYAFATVEQRVKITAKKLLKVVTLKYVAEGICCTPAFGSIGSNPGSLLGSCCKVTANCEAVTEEAYFDAKAGDTQFKAKPPGNSSQCIKNTVNELNQGPLDISPPPDESWVKDALDKFERELRAEENLTPVTISECKDPPSSPENCTWGEWILISRDEIVKDTGKEKSKTYRGPDISNYQFQHNCGNDIFNPISANPPPSPF